MKYWNPRHIHKVRERRIRAEERTAQRAVKDAEVRRRYTPGDARKNARLMLDALGHERNRHMLARLQEGGAMSLTKLAKPFGITLPAAVQHMHTLERAGLITTHKRGRIRFCVYNPTALKELTALLATVAPFCLN